MSATPADENVMTPTSGTETPETSFEVPDEALMGGAEPVPTVQIS